MWAQREYIVLPVHMCNFDSSSGHHRKGGSEKVIYPEGSQRASQKLYKLQVKNYRILSDPHGESHHYYSAFLHNASRCQWEITHTSGKWNIGVKTCHGSRKRGIFPQVYLVTWELEVTTT